MNQKIVQRTANSPIQGEPRANDALDVAPLVTVVPQPYLGNLQAQQPRNVLNAGHGNRHQQKHNKFVHPWQSPLQAGQQIQGA